MDSSSNQNQTSSSTKTFSLSSLDFNLERILGRLLAVMKNPRGVWSSIKNDGDSIFDVYRKYLVFLVAVPVVCFFIGMAIVGETDPYQAEKSRIPFFGGLAYAVVHYLLLLANIYILAFLLDFLAPKFGGTTNRLDSFKLVAFSMSPIFIGGLLNLIPDMSMLGVLFGLYGLYIFYLGCDTMIPVPEEQKNKFLIAAIVSMFLVGIIIGAISMFFYPNIPLRLPVSSTQI